MRAYELPLIEDDSPIEAQLKQIKSYLYRQAENLNYNLKNSDVVSLWKQTAEALSVSSNEEVEKLRRDEFSSLRSLIIKSATSIVKNEESFSTQYSGFYEARSDYGTLTEEGNVYINGNPYTIGQIYKYQSEIVSEVGKYKAELEGYIKTGVLVRDTSSPIFGMEIGYHKNRYVVDDEEYDNSSPAKIRITPLKIGFYQGDYEVAYLERSAIYFPSAHITGGTIELGDNFNVDEFGNMTAKNATINGTINADSGIIGGFEIRGSSETEGNFWPCSFSSILDPTDEPSYQYAVFIRGFYADDGVQNGAIDTTHNVFGIKHKLKSIASWDNEVAPYVYRVTVKGEVYCAYIKPDVIYGDYFRVTNNAIVLGHAGDAENGITAYAKPIEMYTAGEIKIGTFKNKAQNIYVLASNTIRIGQNSLASAEGGTDAPATQNIIIEAAAAFRLGLRDYPVDKSYFYVKSAQFAGVIAPMDNEGTDIGTSGHKWRYMHSKYLTVSSDNIIIGTRGSDEFAAEIYIRTSNNLYIGQDTEPINSTYLCAKNLYVGRKNSNLTTASVTISASSITFSDATWTYTWKQIVDSIKALQARVTSLGG